jgi:alpha-L-fucosidase 2
MQMKKNVIFGITAILLGLSFSWSQSYGITKSLQDRTVDGKSVSGSLSANDIAGDKNKDLTLWYTKPASGWLEALPLGNGRIGAMVFGGVTRERLNLNESTLYSGGPHDYSVLPDLTRHIDMLNRMIRNGEYAEADEYATKHVTGRAVPCYQPLGDITIQFNGTDKVTDYVRELDLNEAVAKTHFRSGGINFTREVFVSHPDNAIIIHLKADRKGALGFKVAMESQHPTAHGVASGNKEFVFAGQLPGLALRRTLEFVEQWGEQWKYPELWDKDGKRKQDASPILYDQKGMFFEVRMRILSCDGRVSSDDSGLNVEGAKEAVIAVAVASSFNGFDKDPVKEGADPSAKTRADLAKISGKTYSQLRNNHLADYKKLFDRVSIQLPGQEGQKKLPTDERVKNNTTSADPSLAGLFFQYGRYLLISSSRTGGQPANLQGIWNVDRIPPWGCAYTTNINMQMNYWAAETTNLSECHEPIFHYLSDVSITGHEVAAKMYGRPGWVLHHNSSIWRGAHPVDWYGFISFWPMGGGWLCQHLWQHYLFTQDIDFLKNTAYPILKGAAEFYDSWLVDDGNGHLVTPVSDSPENQFMYIDEHGQKKSAGMAMGCTLDMAVIRELFQNTIDAEKILNKDVDFGKKLEDKLAHLLPYQIDSKGQFLEYYKEFIESPPRHNTSPYYPLYPGTQFTLRDTPELAKSIRTLISNRAGSRIGGGGWPAAWLAALWARLDDGEKALPYLSGLIKQTHLNLFSGGGSVFQIDANLGFPGAMAEMFLQSHAGEIELLPALSQAWASGSINGLCARGGFEVTMSWQGGKLANATIKSTSGTNAVVRYGEKVLKLKLKKGGLAHLNRNLEIVQ